MKIRNKKNKKSIIASIVVVCLLVVGAGYYFIFQKPKQNPPSIVTQSGQKATSDPDVPKSSGGNNNAVPTDKDSTVSTDQSTPSGVTPNAPIGNNFVSNHHPHLSGVDRLNLETSTCTTTPGAMCKIVFTRNNTTRELVARKTDSNGNVQWDWSLQEVGLTEGVWTITAVASNGNLTASSNDSMGLTVQP